MKTVIAQSATRPVAFENNNGMYYVRDNVTPVENTDPVMYQYTETVYNTDEYVTYLGEQTNSMSDDIAAIMEAIADLYEIIGG